MTHSREYIYVLIGAGHGQYNLQHKSRVSRNTFSITRDRRQKNQSFSLGVTRPGEMRSETAFIVVLYGSPAREAYGSWG